MSYKANVIIAALAAILTIIFQPASAQAFSFDDGVYTIDWGSDGCGELTVKGKKLRYRTVQPCNSGAVKYKATKVSLKDGILSIDQAEFEVNQVRNDGSILGKWKYGTWEGIKVFRPVKK